MVNTGSPSIFTKLYINDINNIDTYSNDSIKQYADDTCPVFNEINLDQLKAKANKLLLSRLLNNGHRLINSRLIFQNAKP